MKKTKSQTKNEKCETFKFMEIFLDPDPGQSADDLGQSDGPGPAPTPDIDRKGTGDS